VLFSIALALTASHLLSGDAAISSRQAQVSLEAAAAAGRLLATANGAPSDSLVLLKDLAPRLTFLDATVDSAAAEEVSVGVLDFSMLFTASSTDGICWGLIETLSGDNLASVYVAFESTSCSASMRLSLVGNLPPDASGRAWSDPWVQ
jgi:hypothetical protein